MIELILGLSGSVLVLLVALIISTRRTAKATAQKEHAEAVLNQVHQANKIVETVIAEQEVDRDKHETSIAQRRYFGMH